MGSVKGGSSGLQNSFKNKQGQIGWPHINLVMFLWWELGHNLQRDWGCIPLLGCHSLNYSSVTLEARRIDLMPTQ